MEPITASQTKLSRSAAYFLLAWLCICTIIFLLIEPVLSLIVYSELFKALPAFTAHFQFPNGFFIDLVWTMTSLALYAVIGFLFLRSFMRLPRLLEIAIIPFLGIGLANFVLEFFAIFFWLNFYTVSLSLFGLVVLLFFFMPSVFAVHPLPLGNGRGEGNPLSMNDLSRKLHTSPEWTQSPEPLTEPLLKFCYYTAWTLLSLITALTFYHALFFPVSYWDALILYINYGKMTYEQGGFPILYCLQVGLGLGANYPHLYPLFQAATAMLFGYWTDFYGQMLPPLAGLGSIVIVYYLTLRFYRDPLIAVLSALSFRAITFVTTYFIWASDYALVMLYTCCYLLFLAWYLEQKSLRSLQPLMLVSAIFPHINYLGWIVWPVTALAALWTMMAKPDGSDQALQESAVPPLPLGEGRGEDDNPQCQLEIPTGVDRQYKGYILVFAAWFLLAFTWYARNWIVTGNPVYAFFPEIFGGKNINLDVLRSSEVEWLRHGNGFWTMGNTFWERIAYLPAFLLANYRVGPFSAGLLLPALLIGWRRGQRFFTLSALLLGLYLFYEMFISGLYLYHIIAVFPILGVFVGRFLSMLPERRMVAYFAIPLLIAGLVPGLSFALMGSKASSPLLSDPKSSPFTRPGMPPEYFFNYMYPQAVRAWNYMKLRLPPNSIILSHENRYHALRDDLQIIHLDDCGLTQYYGSPYPETHQVLWNMGVRHYLQIPDEYDHPITAQLGHREYLNDIRYFKRVFADGGVALYLLLAPPP